MPRPISYAVFCLKKKSELIGVTALVPVYYCKCISDELVRAVVALACVHVSSCCCTDTLLDNDFARAMLIVCLVVRFVHTWSFLCTVFMLSGNFLFFIDTATTEIYTLSLHDALPILRIFAMSIITPERKVLRM